MCFKLLNILSKFGNDLSIVYNLDKPNFFAGGDVYFITGIVQSLKHMTVIKSELIYGHFKDYCFKFSTDSARPYCPHLGPIAPTLWPLLHQWVIITLGWDWELEFLGVSLISAYKWQFSVPNWEILISSLGLSFPNCKLRGPDRAVSQSSFLLQTLLWEVIFHQVGGDRGTHLECKSVSVQGAVLSYREEPVKGDHLPLIYVRGMNALAAAALVQLRMK